ncbi:MAG: hypothetical protein DWQ10_18195 [Calditrichaeota bacterium]|nr:MAG: hypothetical protein DWQ10_18195 [Calditrichota bacterium]
MDQIKDFAEGLINWASLQENVVAVCLVGSHARSKARKDSDIDIVLLCTNPDELIRERSWIKIFGDIKECEIENFGMCTSLRTFYLDNREVEFGVVPLEWVKKPIDSGTKRVISDGIVILLDKTYELTNVVNLVNINEAV